LFIAYLKKHPQLFWLGEVGGNWDLVVNFVCKDAFAFNTIFESLISEKGDYIDRYEILIYIDVYDLSRAYLFNEVNEREMFYHGMQHNENLKLDSVDKGIVDLLSRDASLTNVDLGQKLSVAANTIKNRIERMQKENFLLGYRLFVNPSLLGYRSHMLFLEVTRLDLEKEKQLYAYLKNIKQITFLVKHMGRWRLGMEIETKTLEEFQEIFVDIRGKFGDLITGFESFPLFKDHVIDYFPIGCLE
jgi:Lrp/AsnC family leucine-responsive transcriptional regulator